MSGTVYVVQLREPELWLTATQKWTNKPTFAKRFVSFTDAVTAAGDYDVIIRTWPDKEHDAAVR